MIVYCPNSTTSTCSINCNYEQCQYTSIYYQQPQNLNINCYGDYSCKYLKLFGPQSAISTPPIPTKATVSCTDSSACQNVDFDMKYITNVDIDCGYSSSCYYATFDTKYSNNVNVKCDASRSCYSTSIKGDNANNMSVSCSNNYHACNSMSIWAQAHQIQSLYIECNYADNTACDMKIYVKDDYVAQFLYHNTISHSSVGIYCESRGHQLLDTTLGCDGKLVCCPYTYGNIYYNDAGGEYIVDCNQYQDGCNNIAIDAVYATSLTVICNEPSMCASTSIFAPNRVRQYGNYTLNTTIQCLSSESCKYVNIYGYDNDNINILCNDTGSCKSTTFYLSRTSNIEIICNGDQSCYNTVIEATQATSFNCLFRGNLAIGNGIIHGEFISNMFNISCGSRYSSYVSSACFGLKLYGSATDDSPPRISNLNCESFGCDNLYLYSLNGISDWNISMNGCQECNGIDECINTWSIYCNSSYDAFSAQIGYSTSSQYDSLTQSCSSLQCGCSNLSNYLSSSYDFNYAQNLDICTLERPDIICQENHKCTINCDISNNCSHLSVTARKSSSLTVNCVDESSCLSTVIYCPLDDDAYCNINCDGNNACNLLEIYGSNNIVSLNCFAKDGCKSIRATYAHNLVINCNGNGGCKDSIFNISGYDDLGTINLTCLSNSSSSIPPCSSIIMSVTNAFVDQFNLKCIGNRSCSDIDINIGQAGIINVIAYGPHALYHGDIDGLNANEFHLSCFADTKNHTCFYPKIHAPSKSTVFPFAKKSFLNCYGVGCWLLNIESYNGLDDWIINMNGCGICHNVSSCIDYWYFTCSNNVYSNTFYGDSCSDADTNCQCSTAIVTLSNSFQDDITSCQYPQIPIFTPMTPEPTLRPIISIDPTNSPTNTVSIPSVSPSEFPSPSPNKYPSVTDGPTPAPSAAPSAVNLIPNTGRPTTSTTAPSVIIIHTQPPSIMVTVTDGNGKGNDGKGSGTDASETDSSQIVLYIVIGIAVFIILLACGGGIGLFIYCKRKNKDNMNHIRLEEEDENAEPAGNNTEGMIELPNRGTGAGMTSEQAGLHDTLTGNE